MKSKWLSLIVAIMVLVSGCQGTDLMDYQEAMALTESYGSGVMTTQVSMDLSFNQAGLSMEASRDLSYFEELGVKTVTSYEASAETVMVMVNGSYNYGGMGFDMIHYFNEKEMLIKLPMFDKYIRSEPEQYDTSSTEYSALDRIFKAWDQVLKEEDVFSGKKAFVTTEKGKIKTMTYHISINEDQYSVLKETLLDLIAEGDLKEMFMAFDENGSTMDEATADQIIGDFTRFFDTMGLEAMSGVAYVDFDGRLVEQALSLDLIRLNALPGEITRAKVELVMTYDQLGERLNLTMPQVTDEDILNLEELENLEIYFPEGLY